MSNVVSLGDRREAVTSLDNVFPQSSELYFEAHESPLYTPTNSFDGQQFKRIDTHKALSRYSNTNQRMHLAVVGKKYKVVQNKELFQAVEEQFTKALSRAELRDVYVTDSMAYNGRLCVRDYTFKNVKCHLPVGSKSNVSFRTVVVNGFGGSSIKIMSGAIDFFCMNGMINGQYDTTYGKHTSGLKIGNIVSKIQRSVDVFYRQADVWAQWMGKSISDDDAETFLSLHFSSRMADKLLRQFHIEAMAHGRTVWALYSALTYYATHDAGDFQVRKTQQDHTAATMLTRERQVMRCVETQEFKQLTA